mmetsp:Transcript_44872/g.70298  ORF Transcript_44872/g.70298 Transcript_44872/m.70298 type:complete len:95 (+) Transcript_44872:184-468(+)
MEQHESSPLEATTLSASEQDTESTLHHAKTTPSQSHKSRSSSCGQGAKNVGTKRAKSSSSSSGTKASQPLNPTFSSIRFPVRVFKHWIQGISAP